MLINEKRIAIMLLGGIISYDARSSKALPLSRKIGRHEVRLL